MAFLLHVSKTRVSFVALLLIPGALALVIWLAARANELCKITVIDGAPHLVRGRVPARFFDDVAEIAARPPIVRGSIRVVTESGSPRLVASSDIPADVAQQLRNALGQHQVVHFRTGRRA